MKLLKQIPLFFLFLSFFSNAQDVHFSQFYHVKSFINPASIGDQSEKYKFILHNSCA